MAEHDHGDNPVVQTHKGPVRGRRCFDYDRTPYYSFVRVPYARGPEGIHRFQNSVSQTLRPWAEPLDCTLNIEREAPPPFTEENCLYVNIYTPYLPASAARAARFNLRTTMVFIPGENATLSHRNDLEKYGPQYFMTEGVVLMVVSYRSGILGFAKVEPGPLRAEVPGYAGYEDLCNFFRWLAINNECFGTNTKNTTVFGQGSGASLIADSLYCSREGFPQVTRVILQSINGVTWMGPDNIHIKDYAIFANLAGEDHTEEQVLDILRNMPVEDLVAAEQDYLKQAKFRALNFRFKTRLRNCNFFGGSGCAVMLGFNSCEGLIDKVHFRDIDSDLQDVNKLLKDIWLPDGTKVERDLRYRLAYKIKRFFFRPRPSREKYLQIISDLNHNLETILMAWHMPNTMLAETNFWLYRFAVDGQLNLVKKMHNITDPGACFGDELGYLFKVPGFPPVEPDSVEDWTIRRMVKIWANFAYNGKPNPYKCPILGDMGWELIVAPDRKHNRFYCMTIGETLEYGRCQPEMWRLNFWINLWKPYVKEGWIR